MKNKILKLVSFPLIIFLLSATFSIALTNEKSSIVPLYLLPPKLQQTYYPYKVKDYSIIDNMKIKNTWEGAYHASDDTSSIAQTSKNGEFASIYRVYNKPLELKTYLVIDLEALNPSSLDWISIYLSTTDSYDAYFYVDITSLLSNNSNIVILNRNDFLIGKGSPDWDNINVIRFAFESKQNTSSSIQIEKIATHGATPLCTLWFDDGWESTYDEAYMRMKEKDLKGIVSVIGSNVGTHGYASKDQLNTLYKSGWDISNHTYSHKNLNELNIAEAELEILKGLDFLIDQNFINGSMYFVPPYSEVNPEVLSVIKQYASVSRTKPDSYNTIPTLDLYNIAFKEVTNITSVDTVKKWIDEAIKNELWLVLLFHRLEPSTEWSTQYTPSNFESIIEYLHIKNKTIKTVTVTEALSNMQ